MAIKDTRELVEYARRYPRWIPFEDLSFAQRSDHGFSRNIMKWENRSREYLARLKWPEGFRCAHCADDRAYFLPSKRVVYECAGCGRQVSIIAETIFKQSKKPLVLRFRAIFEVTASKHGVSAAELQRKLGLGRYQTAWSWLTKIRTAIVRPNRGAPLRRGRDRRELCRAVQNPKNRVGPPRIKPSSPPRWRSAARAAAGFALVSSPMIRPMFPGGNKKQEN